MNFLCIAYLPWRTKEGDPDDVMQMALNTIK